MKQSKRDLANAAAKQAKLQAGRPAVSKFASKHRPKGEE